MSEDKSSLQSIPGSRVKMSPEEWAKCQEFSKRIPQMFVDGLNAKVLADDEKYAAMERRAAMDWRALAAAGWSLRDVEDIAVALSPDEKEALAFKPEGSRPFPPAKAWAWGSRISEEAFAKLVARS
jgi:hypothetical protein